MAPWNISRNS